MPTYSYACKDCDNAFDIQQAFSDDALTVCPTCGGALRKRYGSVGVVFKGSGFYRNDSRKGPVGSSPAPAAAGASGGGSAESSSAPSSAGAGSSGSGSSTASTPGAAASTGSSKAVASA